MRLFDYLVESGLPDVSHILPDMLSPHIMAFLKEKLRNEWNTSLELDAKIQLASKLVKESAEMAKKYHSTHHDNDDEEDYDDEEEDDLIPHANENRGDNFQNTSANSMLRRPNNGINGVNSNGAKNGNNSTIWPQPPTRGVF